MLYEYSVEIDPSVSTEATYNFTNPRRLTGEKGDQPYYAYEKRAVGTAPPTTTTRQFNPSTLVGNVAGSVPSHTDGQVIYEYSVDIDPGISSSQTFTFRNPRRITGDKGDSITGPTGHRTVDMYGRIEDGGASVGIVGTRGTYSVGSKSVHVDITLDGTRPSNSRRNFYRTIEDIPDTDTGDIYILEVILPNSEFPTATTGLDVVQIREIAVGPRGVQGFRTDRFYLKGSANEFDNYRIDNNNREFTASIPNIFVNFRYTGSDPDVPATHEFAFSELFPQDLDRDQVIWFIDGYFYASRNAGVITSLRIERLPSPPKGDKGNRTVYTYVAYNTGDPVPNTVSRSFTASTLSGSVVGSVPSFREGQLVYEYSSEIDPTMATSASHTFSNPRRITGPRGAPSTVPGPRGEPGVHGPVPVRFVKVFANSFPLGDIGTIDAEPLPGWQSPVNNAANNSGIEITLTIATERLSFNADATDPFNVVGLNHGWTLIAGGRYPDIDPTTHYMVEVARFVAYSTFSDVTPVGSGRVISKKAIVSFIPSDVRVVSARSSAPTRVQIEDAIQNLDGLIPQSSIENLGTDLEKRPSLEVTRRPGGVNRGLPIIDHSGDIAEVINFDGGRIPSSLLPPAGLSGITEVDLTSNLSSATSGSSLTQTINFTGITGAQLESFDYFILDIQGGVARVILPKLNSDSFQGAITTTPTSFITLDSFDIYASKAGIIIVASARERTFANLNIDLKGYVVGPSPLDTPDFSYASTWNKTIQNADLDTLFARSETATVRQVLQEAFLGSVGQNINVMLRNANDSSRGERSRYALTAKIYTDFYSGTPAIHAILESGNIPSTALTQASSTFPISLRSNIFRAADFYTPSGGTEIGRNVRVEIGVFIGTSAQLPTTETDETTIFASNNSITVLSAPLDGNAQVYQDWVRPRDIVDQFTTFPTASSEKTDILSATALMSVESYLRRPATITVHDGRGPNFNRHIIVMRNVDAPTRILADSVLGNVTNTNVLADIRSTEDHFYNFQRFFVAGIEYIIFYSTEKLRESYEGTVLRMEYN